MSAERRTQIVSVITILTMIVEIGAGLAFGSMALLADGLHMGSHASALAISVFAYRYTRTHATDARFNFGTGKVSSLAAFTSATMLALFALAMSWESIGRFLSPVVIRFDQAILVALFGLVVNGVSLAILGGHGSLTCMCGPWARVSIRRRSRSYLPGLWTPMITISSYPRNLAWFS